MPGQPKPEAHGEIRRCPACGTPLMHGEGECPNCEEQRRTAEWGGEDTAAIQWKDKKKE